MRRRSVLTTLGLCGVLFACTFFTGAPAMAQTAECTIMIASVTPPAGSIVMVTGDHFPPTPRSVPISVNGVGQVGLASIDDNGHFADPIRLPADTPEGLRTLSVQCGPLGGESGTAPPLLATRQISIMPAGAVAAPSQKADKGDDIDGDDVDGRALVIAGVLAIVATLALTTRRRRSQRLVA